MIELNLLDARIIQIVKYIQVNFSQDFFKIVDYWDGDLCAIGLQHEDKLIYISTYLMRSDENGAITYYSEFELIDLATLETKAQVNTFTMITKEKLLIEIKSFFKDAGEPIQ